MENQVENIFFPKYTDFEKIYAVLKEAKESGKHVVAVLKDEPTIGQHPWQLQDVYIDSEKLTEEEWWQKGTGTTQAEYMAKKEARKKAEEEAAKRAAEEELKQKYLIEEVIEGGKKLAYIQRAAEWEEYIRKEHVYEHPTRISAVALGVYKAMTDLENGVSKKEVKKEIYGYDGPLFMAVVSGVLRFSKQGPDYIREMEPDMIKDKSNREFFDKIVAENKKFEQELATGQPSNS